MTSTSPTFEACFSERYDSFVTGYIDFYILLASFNNVVYI